MNNLKPCPFCGSEAGISRVREDADIWIVGCDEILCPGYIWKAAPVYYTRELAEEYWNRRQQPDVHAL